MFKLLFCVALLATAGALPNPQSATGDSQLQDKIKVDQTLQRYAAAYASKNYEQLLAVWPDLRSQKKEAGKIKRHLEDGTLSDEQLTLQPLQVVSTSDGANVQVQRTEQFVKTERTSSSTMGDLRGGSMPTQDPGPTQQEKKKTEKKADTVWIKMHRNDKDWTIISVTEQRP